MVSGRLFSHKNQISHEDMDAVTDLKVSPLCLPNFHNSLRNCYTAFTISDISIKTGYNFGRNYSEPDGATRSTAFCAG